MLPPTAVKSWDKFHGNHTPVQRINYAVDFVTSALKKGYTVDHIRSTVSAYHEFMKLYQNRWE